MELAAARDVLGVSASDDWPTIREAYRTLIRTSHPDLVGEVGADRSVQLNAAYRALVVARREGRLHERVGVAAGAVRQAAPRPARRVRPSVSAQVADDVHIVGNDTLVLASTPGETFRRLIEAANALGEIAYVDRSSAIFEAIFGLEDGSHASFVVSLEWRGHDAACEAYCTLEALDRAESLDAGGVLEQLAQFIPAGRGL